MHRIDRFLEESVNENSDILIPEALIVINLDHFGCPLVEPGCHEGPPSELLGNHVDHSAAGYSGR